MFVGLDLTAGRRPTAAAALSEDLQQHQIHLLGTDEELLRFIRQSGAWLVAIDAPLGLPSGQCCLEVGCACEPEGPGSGRECERALAKLGIGCYFTTKRSIIKSMVYRGMQLRERLERQGLKVIEVYPYATKVRLFGKPLPRKSGAEGQAHMRAAISNLVSLEAGPLTHDEADALLCAYTGWLHAQGRTEALGNAAEGQIHIPA